MIIYRVTARVRAVRRSGGTVDLRLTEQELAFRDRLRAWLADTLPTLPAKPDRDDWPARRR